LSNVHEQPDSNPLFREIVRDFESLERLIQRAIENFPATADSEDLVRLHLARDAVSLGADLARQFGSRGSA
jgi:hypothetical protein